MTKFIVFLFLIFPQQKSDWTFVKNVDGIAVYQRKSGNLKDVKIEITFEQNLSTVVEALMDINSYTKWIYKVEEARLVKTLSNNQKAYYEKIDMPWPAVDRDIVVVNKLSQNPQTKEITIEDVADYKGLPENKNYIRIKDFYASWSLKPSKTGVRGSYIFHSNPGGALPTGVVNMFMDEGPMQSMKGLKKILKDDKYQHRNTYNIIN